MPGPEHLTDLPAPPQEGRPMRPAGGGQPGLAGSPQDAGTRVLAGTGGERQEAQAPAVAGLGTGRVITARQGMFCRRHM
jgi:hypothetical protein